LLVAGVLSASHLNAYGRLHWKSLGVSQNYFDQTGVFVSCLWSAPLALISFGILINSVWNASDLLITVKRQQLGVNKRTKATSNGGAASASAAAAAPAEPLDQEVRTTAATAPTSAIKQRKVKSKG
jgi:hypothetical protein